MERNYGLDVLRIISMIGIIGLHLLGQGGIISNIDYNTLNWYSINVLYTISFCSVNIFAMITGYLYIEKKSIKHESIIKLLFNTVFYCIGITAIFYGFNIVDVRNLGLKTLAGSLFPPIIDRYWYITCYILLFFMIQYINLFLTKMKKCNYKRLLIFLFIFFSIITTFGFKDYFRINGGYSPFWLIYCYFIGAYIKLYKDNMKIGKYKLWIVFIMNTLIVVISKSVIYNVTYNIFGYPIKENLLLQYYSPFIIVNAIILIILFSKMKINKLKKGIITMSSTAFGVYLIHCQPLIYDLVLRDKFVFIIDYNSFHIVIFIIISVCTIYLICSVIDIIRKYLFKLIGVNKISAKFGSLVDKYFLID